MAPDLQGRSFVAAKKRERPVRGPFVFSIWQGFHLAPHYTNPTAQARAACRVAVKLPLAGASGWCSFSLTKRMTLPILGALVDLAKFGG